MNRECIVRRAIAATALLTLSFGATVATAQQLTLDTLIARVSERLDTIETFEADADIYECG